MNWQMIAQQNGIEQPVNGSWEQAICESLGITEPVNGSWIQALAQYGPFGDNIPLENTVIVTDITYGEVFQSKGLDFVPVQITFDFGVQLTQENVYKSFTYLINDSGTIPLFLFGDDDGTTSIYTLGFVGSKTVITDFVGPCIVGESYDIVVTMFDMFQDATTAPKTSLPLAVHTFIATPPAP